MSNNEPPQIGYAASDVQLYVAFGNAATHQASHTADSVVTEFLARHAERPVVILDLVGCSWVDSTFAGWMIRLRKRVEQARGRLVVSRCPPACRSSLDVMGLATLFEFQALAVPPQLTSIPCTEAGADAEIELMIDAHQNLAAVSQENQRVFARIAEELRRELSKRQTH